jgi:GAF domain-containing protein
MSCEPVGSGSTVAEAAQRGASVNVPDLYEAGGEFAAEAQRFDGQRGYRTVSCLAVPLRGQADQIIGVLRLSNARRPEDRQVCPFEPGMQQVIEALCLLAAAALDSYVRQQRLKDQVRELSIQIDDTRKTRQVSQIVESDYFRALQGRARELRGAISQE